MNKTKALSRMKFTFHVRFWKAII